MFIETDSLYSRVPHMSAAVEVWFGLTPHKCTTETETRRASRKSARDWPSGSPSERRPQKTAATENWWWCLSAFSYEAYFECFLRLTHLTTGTHKRPSPAAPKELPHTAHREKEISHTPRGNYFPVPSAEDEGLFPDP